MLFFSETQVTQQLKVTNCVITSFIQYCDSDREHAEILFLLYASFMTLQRLVMITDTGSEIWRGSTVTHQHCSDIQ